MINRFINWLIPTLIFLNDLGVWEMLNFLIVIAGIIIGSVYFFRKRRVPMLNIFISHSKRPEGQNYTSLINIEFRNFTGCSIAICNPYFKYRKLRSDPVAHRDSYSGEAEVKFKGTEGNGLTEIEAFLRHKESTATWIPVDPKHSDEEIKSTLDNKRVGILYFTCVWVIEKPKVRKMVIRI